MKIITPALFSTLFALNTFGAVPAYDTLISHRGESIDAPENTLPAFKMAVDRGFGFECDVYLSKDKRIFTSHDVRLTRMTGGACTKKVTEVTWDEISKLNVACDKKWKGSKYDPTAPALFEDVLALARDGRQIYVEVKHASGRKIVPYLKKALAAQKKATPKNTLFISFSDRICAALKKAMPEYKVFWIVMIKKHKQFRSPEAVIAKLKKMGVDGVDVRYDRAYVTEEFIKTIKNAGFEVHTWTVNNFKYAEEAFARGAQTVTTDCAKALLDEYNKKKGSSNGAKAKTK